MRQVSVKTGLKQRLNDMLGESTTSDSTGPLTSWSIQAAILENIKRVVKGISGGYGRPMAGMKLERVDDTHIRVTEGFGFTANGDIVVLAKSVVGVVPTGYGIYCFSIKHSQVLLPENTPYPGNNGGKYSNIISGGPGVELVSDDKGAVLGNDVEYDDIIESQEDSKLPGDDYVYLGQASIDGGELYEGAIENSSVRGLNPNLDPAWSVEALIVNGTIRGEDDAGPLFDQGAVFTEITLPSVENKIKVGTLTGDTGSFNTGDANKEITVTNGIITNIV